MPETNTVIDLTVRDDVQHEQAQPTRDQLLAELYGNPEFGWAQDVYSQLQGLEGEDIMVDVDQTIYNWDNGNQIGFIRPGTDILFKLLSGYSQNNRVHLWSRNGGSRAREIAETYGLSDSIAAYHNKPQYLVINGEEIFSGIGDLTPEIVEHALGFLPAATVDDDELEAIPGVTFAHVPQFFKKVGDEELAVA